MELWIILAIAAAAFQAVRFMLQKQLSVAGLSAVGATFARFAYAAPLMTIAVALYLVATGATVPRFGGTFWPWAIFGGISQILATVCVVAIFAQRNFAVGITLKKSEVLMTAGVGFVLLGDPVSALGAAALVAGMVALLVLSDAPLRNFLTSGLSRSLGLGLLSGVFFAFSAVGYRAAMLALETPDLALRAGVAVACVTSFQTALMAAWLWWRDPAQIGAVLRSWRSSVVMGCTSVAGSLCWFSAFALQSAAYVFAVGQIEVIFSLLIGAIIFGEKLTQREALGIALLVGSILVLIVGI